MKIVQYILIGLVSTTVNTVSALSAGELAANSCSKAKPVLEFALSERLSGETALRSIVKAGSYYGVDRLSPGSSLGLLYRGQIETAYEIAYSLGQGKGIADAKGDGFVALCADRVKYLIDRYQNVGHCKFSDVEISPQSEFWFDVCSSIGS